MADTLITLRPMLPFISFRPPSGENGWSYVRRISSFRLFSVASFHTKRPLSKNGSCVYASMPCPTTVSTSSCSRPLLRSSRMTNGKPPAAAKWFTSACPFGYTRISSGIIDETSLKSSQFKITPAARAMATKCIVWLVEPPVAIRPIIALMNDFSVSISPIGLASWRRISCTSCTAACRVNASRMGVYGLKNAAAGRCRPMNSIII